MTESNTSSDVGQNVPKPEGLIKVYKHGEERLIGPGETPREKMLRVVQTVRKKQKKQ